jgi:hypothetical protein
VKRTGLQIYMYGIESFVVACKITKSHDFGGVRVLCSAADPGAVFGLACHERQAEPPPSNKFNISAL